MSLPPSSTMPASALLQAGEAAAAPMLFPPVSHPALAHSAGALYAAGPATAAPLARPLASPWGLLAHSMPLASVAPGFPTAAQQAWPLANVAPAPNFFPWSHLAPALTPATPATTYAAPLPLGPGLGGPMPLFYPSPHGYPPLSASPFPAPPTGGPHSHYLGLPPGASAFVPPMIPTAATTYGALGMAAPPASNAVTASSLLPQVEGEASRSRHQQLSQLAQHLTQAHMHSAHQQLQLQQAAHGSLALPSPLPAVSAARPLPAQLRGFLFPHGPPATSTTTTGQAATNTAHGSSPSDSATGQTPPDDGGANIRNSSTNSSNNPAPPNNSTSHHPKRGEPDARAQEPSPDSAQQTGNTTTSSSSPPKPDSTQRPVSCTSTEKSVAEHRPDTAPLPEDTRQRATRRTARTAPAQKPKWVSLKLDPMKVTSTKTLLEKRHFLLFRRQRAPKGFRRDIRAKIEEAEAFCSMLRGRVVTLRETLAAAHTRAALLRAQLASFRSLALVHPHIATPAMVPMPGLLPTAAPALLAPLAVPPAALMPPPGYHHLPPGPGPAM